MHLCYGEPAPGYMSKLISGRSGSITSFPASTTAPPLQSSLYHRLLPWSWLRWGAASPVGTMPSRLKICPGGPMPSRLPVCPGGQMPSWLKFFSCTTHAISCTNLVHHSPTLMHYSRAPLTQSHALLSCTTHILSCTTHVVTHSLHYSHTLMHHSHSNALSALLTYSRALLNHS